MRRLVIYFFILTFVFLQLIEMADSKKANKGLRQQCQSRPNPARCLKARKARMRRRYKNDRQRKKTPLSGGSKNAKKSKKSYRPRQSRKMSKNRRKKRIQKRKAERKRLKKTPRPKPKKTHFKNRCYAQFLESWPRPWTICQLAERSNSIRWHPWLKLSNLAT